MSKFIIKPWPFSNNEIVELYWMCSPYMNEHGEWILKAVFKGYKDVKEVELPWGTLPYLRLGQKYKDGTIITSNIRGSIGEIIIGNELFEICPGFDMPSKLYYFYKKAEYGIQKVCKFKVGKITYFIPSIEIVRSFFAKSKTLTNYILKPNGLDFLIKESKILNDCLYIALSIEVPESIATKETAAHLGWIKYNKNAYEEWTSAFGNIFDEQSMKYGLLELLPPVRENCEWKYRGIKFDNNVLIFELLSSTGVKTPFSQVKYSHPKFERNKVTEVNDKIRHSRNEKNDTYEMVDDKVGTGSRMEQKQSVVELPKTKFLFEDIKSIEKIADSEKEIFLGTKIIATGNSQSGKDENVVKVSTKDWSGEGRISPIEFKNLEIVRGEKGRGLEDFYKVIQYITDSYKQYNISMTEIFLPEGKSFSHYPDGDRRNCAIVKITSEISNTCYIIEIGRSDKWSISTLFIGTRFNKLDDGQLEELLNFLFNMLITNNGHWDSEVLNYNKKLMFYKMKHINNINTIMLANRINDKIRWY